MTGRQRVVVTGGPPPTVKAPGTWEGNRMRATFVDNEAGSVTLENLTIANDYRNEFDASGTTVANCFAETVVRSYFHPSFGQIGSGTITNGTVNFGSLGGWARYGQIWCFERLYSGTDYTDPFNPVPIPPVISEGTCGGCAFGAGLTHNAWGNGPVMASDTYDLDPFTFDATGQNMTIGGTINTFSTLGGIVNGYIDQLSGTVTVAGVPALLPVGLATLAASLTALGARSLRRRRD